MRRSFIRTWALVGSLALAASACSDEPTGFPTPEPVATPLFGATEAFNGVGACMGNDAFNSGLTVGMSSPSSLNCTANDIYLARAIATEQCADAAGNGCVPIPEGTDISCSFGETVFVRVVADLGQSANSTRHDIGAWINPLEAQAMVGNTCNQYNLVVGSTGTVNPDGDQCADMAEGAQTSVDLGVLGVACTPGPNNKVLLGSCLSWTQPGGDRVCPVAGNPDNANGFRFGTVPQNKSKCNCEPFELNIFVPGTVTIRKETEGGDGTFQYTSATLGNFNLLTVGGVASTTFTGVAHGSHSVTETEPSLPWEFVDLSCSALGDGTSITSTVGRTATFNVGPGGTVTCTYKNRKRATITIRKETVPTGGTGFGFSQDIDASGNFSLDHNGSKQFLNVVADGSTSYLVTELAKAGYDLTDIECTGLDEENYTASLAGRNVSITPHPGEDVVCTFTNTKHGLIIIKKETNPPGHALGFVFTGDVSGTLSDGQTAQQSVSPGTYSSTETVPAGWDLTAIECDDANSSGNLGTATATFMVEAGETVTCTFTNERKPRLIVEKQVVGGIGPIFSFSRTGIANFSLSHGGQNDSGFTLAPGTYTVCELDLGAVWSVVATVDGGAAALVNPDFPEDFGNRCLDVELDYGDTKTVVFTNTPPPGGDARTIGYWRNWSSCSGGNQYEKAGDKGMATLNDHLPQTVGNLLVDTCDKGVKILSKRDLSGTNRANDAAYNLASQLLAYYLNISAGAGTCAAASNAAAAGQALLVSINFTGVGQYLRPKDGANYTNANNYAAILDSYNNNTLCP